MGKLRGRAAQGVHDLDLCCGVRDMIRSTHNIRDAKFQIIDHRGQCI